MTYDYLVIGSGIAGLRAAIELSDAGKVLLASKDELKLCNTYLAQGGIAASISEDDSPSLHYADTLEAGAGLCDAEKVEILVEEGPQRIQELIDWNMPFDQRQGEILLGQEGAHSRRRILHSGGDATGRHVWQLLMDKVLANPQIEVKSHWMAIDLIVEAGACLGAVFLEEKTGAFFDCYARSVLLASGGAGQIYSITTNPQTATGDGMAMAYRAGAALADLEFIQFHPTVLYYGEDTGFLITEALRGEGAILRNIVGNAFMKDHHVLGELAPRDIVARAIFEEMEKEGSEHVWLDATHLDREFLYKRFPEVAGKLKSLGIDFTQEYIPVLPAAHYTMGGIMTDMNGESSLSGLFAVGEVACTGVHGANRLASNSLLEGLVFGLRAAEKMSKKKIDKILSKKYSLHECYRNYGLREKRCMQNWAGIERDADTTHELLTCLEEVACEKKVTLSRKIVEDDNMWLVATLCAQSIEWRKESRGSHYRTDYPGAKNEWQKHLIIRNNGVEEIV